MGSVSAGKARKTDFSRFFFQYPTGKQKEQLELLKKLKIFPLRNYVHFEPVETISDAQCHIQFAVVPKGLDDELFFECMM